MRIPLYIFIILQLLIVSFYDLKTKKISNLWPIFNLALAVSLLLFFPKEYPFTYLHFVIPLSVFTIGFFFYQFQKIGAGDTKLIFSLVLLVPQVHQLKFILGLCVGTVLVGFPILMYNLFKYYKTQPFNLKTFQWKEFRKHTGKKFSFGPVILLGWLLFGYEKFF